MFIQTRAVYIVGTDAGNPRLIHENLKRINCLNLFFGKILNPSSDVFYNKFLKNLPPETVFSVKVSFDKTSKIEKKYFISIPFMSSHFSLPLKIGEIIWIYPYEPAMNEATKNDLVINSYYLSRVHSMLSTEDVSYCYADRDYSIFNPYNLDITNLPYESLNSREKIEYSLRIQDAASAILRPSIDKFSDETKFIQSTYFNNAITAENFRSVPRVFKNSADTVLQGSHNTSLSLSSSRLRYLASDSDYSVGEIKLTAGINQNIFRFLLASNQSVTVVDENYSKSEKDTILSIYEHNSEKFIQVFNGLHFETIKSLSHFSNINLALPDFADTTFTPLLQATYDSDLTRITISENSTDFIDINSDNEITLLDVENDIEKIQKSSNIKSEKEFTINKLIDDTSSHTRSKLVQLENNSSFVAISDNITLSLHKNSPGHLSLIQPNALDNKSTQIKITDKGNILLDGNKILIGDYNRLPEKSSGGDALVFLGHSEDSQSLVLGEQLKEFMLEILDVQRQSMHDLKELLKTSAETKKSIQANIKTQIDAANSAAISAYSAAISSIFQTTLSSPSLAGPPTTPVTAGMLLGILQPIAVAFSPAGSQNAFIGAFNPITTALKTLNDSLIENFDTEINNKLLKRDEELSQRLEVIEKNINEILSKFSKTS